jgi:hypothetical protein
VSISQRQTDLWDAEEEYTEKCEDMYRVRERLIQAQEAYRREIEAIAYQSEIPASGSSKRAA